MRTQPVIKVKCGLLVFGLNDTAHADNAWNKLARGTLNLCVSPLEFFQGISDGVNEQEDLALGISTGVSSGLWNTAKRAAVGIYEIVTFPFPFPKGYAPVIEEPRFLGKK